MEDYKKALVKLKEIRDKYREQCPSTKLRSLENAWKGKSLRDSIDSFCNQCVGYSQKDIELCTAVGCPIWPQRPYQSEESIKEAAIWDIDRCTDNENKPRTEAQILADKRNGEKLKEMIRKKKEENNLQLN